MHKGLVPFWLVGLLWALTAPSHSQPEQWAKEGQTYQTLLADLEGDGKPEKIGLVAYRVSDRGTGGS